MGIEQRKPVGTALAVATLLLSAACASGQQTGTGQGGASPSAGADSAAAAQSAAIPTAAAPTVPADSAPADPQETELRAAADAVLGALAAQDYQALAELVHPVKGVRFTPYGYIDVDQSVALMPEHVAELGEDDKTYVWGADPGTGEALQMTFAQYNEKFLYDQQFLHADEIAVNRSLRAGSSTDNTADVFPGDQFVDYHFSGFDEQYDGLDWETLRVVLQEREGRWYVVGLIHDSWTP